MPIVKKKGNENVGPLPLGTVVTTKKSPKTYKEMVQEAIETLSDGGQKGVSKDAILKYIVANYTAKEQGMVARVETTLRNGVRTEQFSRGGSVYRLGGGQKKKKGKTTGKNLEKENIKSTGKKEKGPPPLKGILKKSPSPGPVEKGPSTSKRIHFDPRKQVQLFSPPSSSSSASSADSTQTLAPEKYYRLKEEESSGGRKKK